MTVEELIEKLQGYPPTMRVLGRGYESGWNDLYNVEALNVNYYPDNPWYEGQYQDNDLMGKFQNNIDAVCID